MLVKVLDRVLQIAKPVQRQITTVLFDDGGLYRLPGIPGHKFAERAATDYASIGIFKFRNNIAITECQSLFRPGCTVFSSGIAVLARQTERPGIKNRSMLLVSHVVIAD